MTTTHLGDTGIVLHGDADNDPDTHGVVWTISGSGPFAESPPPRDVTGERANADGQWDATEFYGPRTGSLEGLAKATTHEALHAAEQRFKAAVNLGFDLRHVEPGFDRTVRARRDGMILWTEITDTIARYSAPIRMPDPVLYSTDLATGSTPFPSSTGGLVFPITFPITFSGIVIDGAMTVVNDGTVTAWPTFRIDGPVVQPVIQNDSTGQAMRLDLSLVDGEWLTVNTDTHQVLGNGQTGAPRRDKFWGDWFGLPPGPTSLRFLGASAGPGALLTATWPHAWI